MKLLLTCLLATCSLIGAAQVHCDGNRYIEPVFASIDSVIGVQFGSNTTVGGFQKNLLMDIYLPPSEFFFERPLIVFAHGGSFMVGSRKEMRPLCIAFAERGYVVATIDYRLFDAFSLPLDSLLEFDVAVKATMDMKAAVRWFRENAAGNNDYGIDTHLIFAGGVSAGAIAALHTGFLDADDFTGHVAFDSILQENGGIHGNSSSNHQYSDAVKGVVNYSGALKDARWIDPGEPVVFSVHDELDGVVPYNRDNSDAMGVPVELWGSNEVNQKARAAGIRSQLVTIANSTQHVSYFLNGPATEDFALAIDSAGYFMEYAICDRALSARREHRLPKPSILYPNPADNTLRIRDAFDVDQIEIIDATGRVVQTTSVMSSSSIDISNLQRGIYTIWMINTNAVIGIEQIVKQ